MFRAYLSDEERYRKCFAGGYYLTGDLARRDRDGYYWFIGRADDVIKSSGHLIGPFEVESVLLEHPAVAEAGVIGKPDPVALEIVKAFVALKPGYEPTDALRQELLGFARVRLGAAVAPKEIEFRPSHSEEPRRQDHAPAAQGAGAGAARRRHLDAGGSHEPRSRASRRQSRARVRLLHEMLRIRRFEEKCAELYSAGKIRGFLHLYIGEEAVAVGAMQALGRTTPSSRPIASTATRWRAASPRTA